MNDHSGDEMDDIPVCRDSLSLLAMTDVMTENGWLYAAERADEIAAETERQAGLIMRKHPLVKFVGTKKPCRQESARLHETISFSNYGWARESVHRAR